MLIIAAIGLTLFQPEQGVKIASSHFACEQGECRYSFELQNISDEPQRGAVYILLKYGKVKSGYAQDIGFIKQDFSLLAKEQKRFSGVYKSHKELNAYFRLNSKEI